MSADTEDAIESAAAEKVAGYFLEWDSIEDGKDELAERSKDLFKAMKDEGYDAKASRVTFREKRVELLASPEDVSKAEADEATLDLYRSALNRGLAARARPAHSARENIEQFGAAKGVKITPSSGDVFADLGVERPAHLPAHNADAETGEILTQEQPATASQSGHANEVRTDALRSSDVGKLSHDVSAPAESASDEISCINPHSPAVLPGKADKTSEAVLSSTASLAPPNGTKHTNTDYGSDPLNNAPSVEVDRAGAVANPMAPVAPATISKPLNPNCRRAAKGEQCALMHSQASCSACANAAMKARAA